MTCLQLDDQHLSKISNLENLENLRFVSFNNNDITKIEVRRISHSANTNLLHRNTVQPMEEWKQ